MQHPRRHIIDHVGRRPRQRRVRTHAAGVRAGVIVVGTLEILRGLQRHNACSVGDREERDLRTVEELLHHHRTPAGKARSRVGDGDGTIIGDHNTLAAGQTIVLHDVRGSGPSKGVEGTVDLIPIGTHQRHCRRYTGLGHHFLGERLAAFQSSRLRGRPEASDSRRANSVGCTCDQRSLRTDDN